MILAQIEDLRLVSIRQNCTATKQVSVIVVIRLITVYIVSVVIILI